MRDTEICQKQVPQIQECLIENGQSRSRSERPEQPQLQFWPENGNISDSHFGEE